MLLRFISLLSLLVSLFGCAAPIELPDDDAKTISKFAKVVDVTASGNRLLIYSYGSPPRLIAEDCIKGTGLNVFIVSSKTGTSWDYGLDEDNYDVTIDYSRAVDGLFNNTEYTVDPRQDMKAVPLVLRTISCPGGAAPVETDKFVMPPEQADDHQVADFTRHAIAGISSSATKPDDDDFLIPVAHLRNIGIGQPLAAMKAFAEFRAEVGRQSNVADSELLREFENEVGSVKAVKQ